MLSQEQLRSAVGLIGPLGRILELTHDCLLAHHDSTEHAEDCEICLSYMDRMGELLVIWEDAKANATEHWPV